MVKPFVTRAWIRRVAPGINSHPKYGLSVVIDTPVESVTSNTVAVAEPLGPDAVTVAVAIGGSDAGAVNSPVELMVPVLAVQLVAPVAVNCTVLPRTTVTESGAIVSRDALIRVTAAVAIPLLPVTVMVTAVLEGRVGGAV